MYEFTAVIGKNIAGCGLRVNRADKSALPHSVNLDAGIGSLFPEHIMMHSYRFHHKSTKIVTVVMLCSVGMTMLTGCASNYGGLKGSDEITEIFETNQILPDHRYYYNGFEAVPYAIVGIHNDYVLTSSAWKIINLTPEILNTLAFRMQAAYSPLPRGAWINGPDGQRLGIWYSSEGYTAVRLIQENQIKLAPPQPAELRGIP